MAEIFTLILNNEMPILSPSHILEQQGEMIQYAYGPSCLGLKLIFILDVW